MVGDHSQQTTNLSLGLTPPLRRYTIGGVPRRRNGRHGDSVNLVFTVQFAQCPVANDEEPEKFLEGLNVAFYPLKDGIIMILLGIIFAGEIQPMEQKNAKPIQKGPGNNRGPFTLGPYPCHGRFFVLLGRSWGVFQKCPKHPNSHSVSPKQRKPLEEQGKAGVSMGDRNYDKCPTRKIVPARVTPQK